MRACHSGRGGNTGRVEEEDHEGSKTTRRPHIHWQHQRMGDVFFHGRSRTASLRPPSSHWTRSPPTSLALSLSLSFTFPLFLSFFPSHSIHVREALVTILSLLCVARRPPGGIRHWPVHPLENLPPAAKKRVEAPSLLFFSSIWLEIRSPRLASGSDYGVGWGRGTDCENATGYGRALWIQEYTDFWRRSHRRLLLRKPEAGRRRSATTTTTDRRCLGIFFFLLLPYALHYARGAAKRSIGQSENPVAIHRRTGNGNRSVCGPFIFCLCVWRMGRGGFVIDVERSGHNRKSSRLIVDTETVSSLGRTDRR